VDREHRRCGALDAWAVCHCPIANLDNRLLMNLHSPRVRLIR
jgi:hypothetical protein